MNQGSWKFTEQDEEGGHPGKHRTFWAWLLGGQILVLGFLVAVTALKVGLCHAIENPGWRKFASPVMELCARGQNPSWGQVLGRLTDDDEDDDEEDDDSAGRAWQTRK